MTAAHALLHESGVFKCLCGTVHAVRDLDDARKVQFAHVTADGTYPVPRVREILTVAELDALPVGSVVRLASGQVFARDEDDRYWYAAGFGTPFEAREVFTEHPDPATVLFRPDAPQPATGDDAVDDVLAYLVTRVTPHEAELVAHTWAEDIVQIARPTAMGSDAVERAEVLRQAYNDLTGDGWGPERVDNVLARVWDAALAAARAGEAEPTLNGLTIRDWFDIAVTKEQAIDGYLTRIAELEAEIAQHRGEAEPVTDKRLADEVEYRIRTAVALAKGGHPIDGEVQAGRTCIVALAAQRGGEAVVDDPMPPEGMVREEVDWDDWSEAMVALLPGDYDGDPRDVIEAVMRRAAGRVAVDREVCPGCGWYLDATVARVLAARGDAAPTVSAERVERAARALWKCWNPHGPAWNAARNEDRDEARAQARAALDAGAREMS